MNFFKKLVKSKYPYIIAEIGNNHNGKTKLAKKMVYAAKKAGADCVKFQSWSADTIFSKVKYQQNYFLKDDYRKRKDTNLRKIVEKYAFTKEQLLELKIYCKKIKIDFASTPFSIPELDFLVNKLKPNFIKIASMDLNNYPFLKEVAKRKLPIFLSTGLSNISEIEKAIKIILKNGNSNLLLMHCVSIYPTKFSQANLNSILYLSKRFKFPVGYSDHTLGTMAPNIATSYGAKVIEKHFTTNKSMSGWDHKMSVNTSELKQIVNQTKSTAKLVGEKKFLRPESKKIINEFRRSIVSSEQIFKGEKISYKNITFKRPGTGIQPGEISKIIGKRVRLNIPFDTIIKKKYLKT